MLPDNVHLDQNVSGLHLPVELPPLVPEGEAVRLQIVAVYSLQEVGRSAPLNVSTLLVVPMTRSDQTSLVYSDTSQLQSVQSGPVLVSDVPLQQEDKLQVRLVPDILQAGDLKSLQVARVRLRTEPKCLQLVQSVLLEGFL